MPDNIIEIEGKAYIPSKDAAQRAGCTVDTIALWCREGDIQCFKRGGKRWLIEVASLEAYLSGKSIPQNGEESP